MNARHLAATVLSCAASAGALATPAVAASTHSAHHRAHHSAQRVHRRAHARTVSFAATVVRSGRSGLVVRTAQGKVLSFAAAQVRAAKPSGRRAGHLVRAHALSDSPAATASAGNVVINLVGLQPGVTVEITETTDAQGTVTITITLPASTGQQTVSGVVTEVDTDALTLQSSDGSELRLHVSADTLSQLGLQTCDTATIAYHQDAGILVADTVTPTGSSAEGDCAPSSDASGTITQVSADGLTISTDQGSQTFSADPSSEITDGYAIGDLVDVTYTAAPDGSLTASDVEYVEGETTGAVTSVTTSVTGGSLTITDDDTGQPDVFGADPVNGVQITSRAFTGIGVGDSVDVTYHQTAAGLVADTVSQQ